MPYGVSIEDRQALRPFINETHADSFGVGWVAVDKTGFLSAKLVGFGTAPVTRGCVETCVAGIRRLGPEARGLRGLFDVAEGYGCSPLAVPPMVAFLRGHGASFARVAVVARGAPLRIARLVARAAGFRSIRCFAAREEACLWLAGAD